MGEEYIDEIELSIVMPCLNEAETLKICIDKAKNYIQSNNIKAEIVIGDNGSVDGSQEIALNCGAILIRIPEKGYGRALMGAFRAARGKYIIMGDSDDSYDFRQLNPFLEKLREGFDLVVGNRFKGDIQPNAMPFINKYVGNPLLSTIARLFIGSKIGDFHCGLRGFNREKVLSLDLKTTGMEFASEMIVAATIHYFKITEIPVILSPDGRSRPSHLRPWHDGWRHLRFLMRHIPGPLFLIREFVLMLGGLLNRVVSFFRSH
jgi:glycosyltransferase involved in cell wall biosynthesis